MPLLPSDAALLDALADPVLIVDADWRFVHHNSHAGQIDGRAPEELIGRTLWEIYPELPGTPMEAAYRRSMAERTRVEFVADSPRSPRLFRVTCSPYRDGLCVHYRDISAEGRAVEELSRSRELLETAEELSHVASWSLDLVTDKLTCSLELYRIFRFPFDTPLTGAMIRARIEPEQRSEALAAVRQIVESGMPAELEVRVVRMDGSTRTLFARARVQRDGTGRPASVVGSIQDITERVQSDAALRRAHQLLATVIEDAPLGVVTIDAAYRVTSWNPAAEHIFGWTAAELIGQPLPTIPDERRAELLSMLDEDGDAYTSVPFETQYRRRDGTMVDVQVATAPLRGAHGEITGAVAFMGDLTERNAALRALREREDQHRLVTDGLPVLIAYLDRDERYRFVNRAYEQTFGVSRDDIIGRSLRDVLGAAQHDRVREHLRAALAGSNVTFETEVDVAGATRHLSVTYLPHRDRTGAVVGIYSMLSDATERRQLEEQLRQSQKMEAVGRLAGGVAHDFNNLLTVVTVHCEMLLAQLPDASQLRSDIEEIQNAGRRAAALTRQLLAFSRRQVLTLEQFSLNDVVSEAERMFRRIIGEDVHVQTALEPGLALVRADRGQMTQVLMNLVVNARDAMPAGGRLAIATRTAVVDAAAASRRRGLATGEYVELTIADTGTGMDETTRARIFEPFFTTKESGKGTGLGLSTVYGIVKQLEGYIFVDSAVGKGTTFTIYLPRAKGAAEASPAGPVLRVSPPRGTEVVLLVEDDMSVRQIARRALERQGYVVLEADNGEEGLRVAERHGGPIDLLLTDVIMPALGGPALAERLRARRPALRVLFMSGYNEAAIANQGVLAPGATLIEKPFSADALAHAVREVLGAARSRAVRHPAG